MKEGSETYSRIALSCVVTFGADGELPINLSLHNHFSAYRSRALPARMSVGFQHGNLIPVLFDDTSLILRTANQESRLGTSVTLLSLQWLHSPGAPSIYMYERDSCLLSNARVRQLVQPVIDAFRDTDPVTVTVIAPPRRLLSLNLTNTAWRVIVASSIIVCQYITLKRADFVVKAEGIEWPHIRTPTLYVRPQLWGINSIKPKYKPRGAHLYFVGFFRDNTRSVRSRMSLVQQNLSFVWSLYLKHSRGCRRPINRFRAHQGW